MMTHANNIKQSQLYANNVTNGFDDTYDNSMTWDLAFQSKKLLLYCLYLALIISPANVFLLLCAGPPGGQIQYSPGAYVC